MKTQNPAPTEREIELTRALNRMHETAMEAAAMLLLLGRETAHCHEHGESWADDDYGSFLACGIQLLSMRTAEALHQATKDEKQP